MEMPNGNHPPRGHRVERRDVMEITTARRTIVLRDDQYFCVTGRAWEVWQDSPTRRILRIPADRVKWVSPRPGLQANRDESMDVAKE